MNESCRVCAACSHLSHLVCFLRGGVHCNPTLPLCSPLFTALSTLSNPTPPPSPYAAADVYMIDEPSSYLDVRQRLKAAEVIRSLLGPDK